METPRISCAASTHTVQMSVFLKEIQNSGAKR